MNLKHRSNRQAHIRQPARPARSARRTPRLEHRGVIRAITDRITDLPRDAISIRPDSAPSRSPALFALRMRTV